MKTRPYKVLLVHRSVNMQAAPYMRVLPAKPVRVKSGNAFADTSRAQPLQSEGAAFGLSLAKDGNVIVELKSPYNDGTTHVILSRSRTRG
jgi:hypothetical protein